MATKAELESREVNCKTVEDFCKLALDALIEPKDEAYAKELVSTAEGDCSFPKDYISVAEVYVKLGNKESAGEMYEEAEGECFEPMEIALLGHSIAVCLGDKGKAKELLENAAKDAKKISEILTISNYVREDLEDFELAKSLMGKVESQCKEFKDYKNLAETIIKDSGDKDTAKSLLKSALNKIDGIEETVMYAETVIQLFGETEMAVEALESVEDDAQFTKDYVLLAKGYLCLGDNDKAKELLESGIEFAMTGEEHIDLAVGYWTLLKDKEAASEEYEKGLKDLNDIDKLLGFAKSIAVEIGNITLAKKFYERAESKITGAKEFIELAQAVHTDLKDTEYATVIYDRATQSIQVPKDLMLIASEINKNLGNKDRVKEVYLKAFDKIENFQMYIELFDEQSVQIDDKLFGKDILKMAHALAQTTPEMLRIVNKAIENLHDKEYGSEVLTKAEECVTSLNEMKDVALLVKEKFSENADWVKRVDEKLTKREKNQEKYDAYQKREESAKTFKDIRLIIDDMMAELDDKYYAKKLLSAGLEILNNLQLNLNNYQLLIQSITKYLKDDTWIKSIFNFLIENRIKFFFDYCGLCHIANEELTDKDMGKELSIDFLKLYESKLDNNGVKKLYDYTNLAKAVSHLTGDSKWAIRLLDKAEAQGGNCLSFIYLGYLARLFGDNLLSQVYFDKAVKCADTGTGYQMLVERLTDLNIKSEDMMKVYDKGSKLTNSQDKLTWAEGYAELFNDKIMAAKIYKKIAPDFKSDSDKEMFEKSKKIHLEGTFW